MGKRRKAPPPKRRWMPLAPATAIMPSEEKIAGMRAEAERLGLDVEEVMRLFLESRELWKNDRYTVTVRRHADGWVNQLSIRRNDRGTEMPWRHLQRIKSELAGDEAEAFELFPAESRLVDTANQRWLWCLPPGDKVPAGFDNGRHVSGPDEAARVGARQAPLEESER